MDIPHVLSGIDNNMLFEYVKEESFLYRIIENQLKGGSLRCSKPCNFQVYLT